MRSTSLQRLLSGAAALIALAGTGAADAAPAVQTQQVVSQFVDPDAPSRRSGAVRSVARPPVALPAAASAAAEARADEAPNLGPLLLALLGFVLLLAARTRRRED